jgi:hypothetical protein
VSDQLSKWLGRAVLAVSGLVFASWLLIAVVHVDDNYHVNHVTGTWFALARYVNEGVLYPPLFDGNAFGGTRNMPLQFVVHAGVARLTGEYLVSGKLLNYAGAVALLTLVFVACRRVSGSAVLAVGLVAAVLGTEAGLFGATTYRGDIFPAALQLGALYAVTRKPAPGSWSVALAGLLCALAFFSKLTAVWGAVALIAWFALRDRRRLRWFALSLAASSAALFAVFEAGSDGRMSQNVFGLAAAGGHMSVKDTLTKFVDLGQTSASAVWVLVPFALAMICIGIVRRRPTVYELGLLAAAAILLPVLSDVGTVSNHLIDVEVLTVVVAAEAVQVGGRSTRAIVLPLLLVAILWGTLTSYQAYVRPPTGVAVRALLGRETPYEEGAPLEDVISPSDHILADDPYLATTRGQDPVVLDAFMLVRLARDHPDWQAALIRQIANHRFTKVVLLFKLDPRGRWFRIDSLGTPVATAIARSYRLAYAPADLRQGEDYWIYEPRQRKRSS